jgi:peroxiredoxin
MATETGAAKLKSGQIILAFSLTAVDRAEQIGPWNYKQRCNLAIFFLDSAGRQKCVESLQEAAANYGEYQRLETEALAIAPDGVERRRRLARELDIPISVLVLLFYFLVGFPPTRIIIWRIVRVEP